ncbi:MAG: acetyltransferase [Microthrixaceae bacterium]
MQRVMVVGASDHARCTVDVALARGDVQVVGAVADGDQGAEVDLLGVPLLGGTELVGAWWRAGRIDAVAVAIGANHARVTVAERLLRDTPGLVFATLVHPSAEVADTAVIEPGVVMLPRALVGPRARVGRYGLLTTQCNLNHDCVMAEGASLGPGAQVGGGAVIGRESAVAIGAVVRHGGSVGDFSVLGAGAVLTHALPDRVLAWGIPARVIRSREPGDRYL